MRKRVCVLMTVLVLTLSACGGTAENEAETLMLEARSRFLEMTACTAHLELTADYGRRVYTYGVDLTWAGDGETVLTLTAPENVAGTTARIAGGETALEFDGVMVETGPLSDTGLSPIDAVPALLGYAREGFLAECVMEDWEGEQRLHAVCRDPEKAPGEGIECDLWFAPDTFSLLRGELSERGFTVIQCDVSEFSMECPPKE